MTWDWEVTASYVSVERGPIRIMATHLHEGSYHRWKGEIDWSTQTPEGRRTRSIQITSGPNTHFASPDAAMREAERVLEAVADAIIAALTPKPGALSVAADEKRGWLSLRRK